MSQNLKKGVKMSILAILMSQLAFAMDIGPTPFPVFLKEGFSSILEFEEAPTQVVLGDQNLFQVEKLKNSIVIKALTPYATTNMFVYFKGKETRLFILTASEESEPTYYKKFASIVAPAVALAKPNSVPIKNIRGARLKKAAIDKKKDYLTVDFAISADSNGKLSPSWDLIRLKYKNRFISPSKLWSERREIQRESSVDARLIFQKPNVPSDLRDTSIVIPLKGSAKSLTIALKRGTS